MAMLYQLRLKRICRMLFPPVLEKEQLFLTLYLKGKNRWLESCKHIHVGSMKGKH